MGGEGKGEKGTPLAFKDILPTFGKEKEKEEEKPGVKPTMPEGIEPLRAPPPLPPGAVVPLTPPPAPEAATAGLVRERGRAAAREPVEAEGREEGGRPVNVIKIMVMKDNDVLEIIEGYLDKNGFFKTDKDYQQTMTQQ